MNHDDAEVRSGIPATFARGMEPTSGSLAHHRVSSRPANRPGSPLTCTIECDNCPWVDFRDYDQCGLTFSRQCLELVASP